MKKTIVRLALAAVLVLALAACGSKGPTAELKAAEDAISAAKAGHADPANADLKQAEETLAKAKAEIDAQMSGAIKDFTVAKTLLAEAKNLGEKALATQKTGTASKTEGAGAGGAPDSARPDKSKTKS